MRTADLASPSAPPRTRAEPPRRLRVVLLGINYEPEVTGIAPFNAALCRYLAAQGHEVAAVTTFSYYPQWRKAPEDAGRWSRRELREGVAVYRGWHYVPATVTSLRRIAHELSFGLVALYRALTLERADVYLVVSPPLILGAVGWLVSRLQGSRYVMHVQDLQPDAAVSLGMLRRGWLVRGLYGLEAFAYRYAAFVSGISDGMLQAFDRKGLPAARRIFFPNWLRAAAPAPARGAEFRARQGIAADAFLAVYSGNLGRKQGIEILLEAAAALAAQTEPAAARVVIVIAGAGAGRDELARQIEARALANLRLLPLLEESEYQQMLAATDVGLITQAPGTGQFFFPSKLLSLLAAGQPVVTVADEESELARAVAEGGFGVNVQPHDPAGLVAALQRVSADPAWRDQLAKRTHWVRRFTPEIVLPRFERDLLQIVPPQPTRIV